MPAVRRKLFFNNEDDNGPKKGGIPTGKRAAQGNLGGGSRGQRDPNSGFSGQPRPLIPKGGAGLGFFSGTKRETSAERKERLDAQKARDKTRGVGKKRGGAGSFLLNKVSNKKTLLGGS
jgi:hypothetical protein